jgi:L-lysine exporter family protein LysE/ArgO
MESEVQAFLRGVSFALPLAVAMGPTNLFVIRQGLVRTHAGVAVLGTFAVDALMVLVSLVWVESVSVGAPRWSGVLKFGAVIFMLLYIWSVVRSWRAPRVGCGAVSVSVAEGAGAQSGVLPSQRAAEVFALAMGGSLMNPAVWIDMVVLTGGFLSAFEASVRLWGACGVIATSLAWFVLLGFGATVMGTVLKNPAVLRTLEVGAIALLVGQVVLLLR